MARIKNNICKHKVKAVTLLESVIATTVLMILFGILMGVFTRVLHVTYTMRHVQAEHLLQSLMQDVELNQTYFDHTYNHDPFTIERHIRPSTNLGYIVVELLAKDATDSTVARYKELIQIQK